MPIQSLNSIATISKTSCTISKREFKVTILLFIFNIQILKRLIIAQIYSFLLNSFVFMKILIIQPMMSFTREKWSIRFQGRHDDDGYIDKCIYGGYIER